jgi:hypothetical protein
MRPGSEDRDSRCTHHSRANALNPNTRARINPTGLQQRDTRVHAALSPHPHIAPPPEARPLGAGDADLGRRGAVREFDAEPSTRTPALRRDLAAGAHTPGCRRAHHPRPAHRRPPTAPARALLAARHAPQPFRRSLLGSKLRRLLSHKDFAAHIRQLIAFLRNLDTHAAHLAHCMRRRRRRLFRTLPSIAPASALTGAPTPPPAFADSS